ncbi:hypothetical protein ACIQ57_01215 [Lysinibacillus xylanilyticus]|uniref:hypothetical protein n=1 Tax=Lysinibacillus xylanilyticus TaxID=582475 RepID=UPI0037FF09BF
MLGRLFLCEESKAADRSVDVTGWTIELTDRRSDATDRTPHIQKRDASTDY